MTDEQPAAWPAPGETVELSTRATLADAMTWLPYEHKLAIEFSRPLAANRGSATISNVEAIGIVGGVLLVQTAGGLLEGAIPLDRIAYIRGEAQ